MPGDSYHRRLRSLLLNLLHILSANQLPCVLIQLILVTIFWPTPSKKERHFYSLTAVDLQERGLLIFTCMAPHCCGKKYEWNLTWRCGPRRQARTNHQAFCRQMFPVPPGDGWRMASCPRGGLRTSGWSHGRRPCPLAAAHCTPSSLDSTTQVKQALQ